MRAVMRATTEGAVLAILRRRRFPSEGLLAAAAGGVGLLGIASALTPSLPSRSDFVQGVLPPGVVHGARLLALVFGVALVVVSRSLARRRRRAWYLAVALVVLTVAAHLVEGVDAEEIGAAVILCSALVVYRRRFDVPGDPAALQPLLAAGGALAASGAFLGLYELHRVRPPEDVEDVVTAIAILLAFWALHLWLRPWTERVHQSLDERRLARKLVRAHGRDSLAFFALRRDKTYFFSPGRSAFLAYRVVAGTALVSGDPVGEAEEHEPLVRAFLHYAHARGWRPAIVSASADLLPLYRSLGLRAVKLGEEAIVQPREFSLEGRGIRKVRQSVNRIRRAGYRAVVRRAAELLPSERRQLEEVSREWLGRWPERGFSMAMDGLFAEPDLVFVIAQRPAGQIDGFLELAPCPAGDMYSLSAMRRRRPSPNGLMEFLIAEGLAWAAGEGASEVSLNFCVFADILRPRASPSRGRRVLRFALLRLDGVFQLDRLLAFNRKFSPEWRPRFVCFERLLDAPVVGLAFMRAETLLVPPGPWTSRR